MGDGIDELEMGDAAGGGIDIGAVAFGEAVGGHAKSRASTGLAVPALMAVMVAGVWISFIRLSAVAESVKSLEMSRA